MNDFCERWARQYIGYYVSAKRQGFTALAASYRAMALYWLACRRQYRGA